MTATARQMAFAQSLRAERQVSDESWAIALQVLEDPNASPRIGGPISEVIEVLKAAPKKVAAAARPAAGLSIEKAKYAIPAELIHGAARRALGGNDHLFVEVKEYKGHRYMRQLHGAPGAFTRSRLTRDEQAEVVGILTGRELEYTQLFGELYSVCSVCCAELTDEVSRLHKMGPVCRTRFGL